MTARSPSADLSFFDGETLLRIIATALVSLSKQHSPRNPVYGDEVQSAFNHLVLLCLRRGVPPPVSVPDMVSWAAMKPLREWPLVVPEDLDAIDGCLVDGQTRTPTQRCFEWVICGLDPIAEEFENQLMVEAIAQSRVAQSPDSYTAFRRLLITRPVLTGTERTLTSADVDLGLLHETIKRCYEPVAASYRRDGRYTECARCHCLLVPVGRAGYRCELDRCRRENHPKVGRLLDPTQLGGVYQLSRPLRMFITGPGLAETDLEASLIERGLAPQMWPNFDAYDLRITLPNRRVWAIDVKDRANPALLGRGARPLRPDPPYDKAFLVVPQYRFEEREAYGRIFDQHRPDELESCLELLSEERFLGRLDAELRRIRRGHRAGVHPEGRDDA
ncbi:MAG: hypothetical protein ACRDSR_25835 [Pseudonocardiaceae bacterium]